MRPPLPEYPWDRVVPYRKRAAAHPDGIVDLSIGSPVDETPRIVRAALAEQSDAHAYPTTVGTAELQAAIVEWFERRRGVPGLERVNVLPTVGSKEMVALLPFFLGLGEGDVVVHPRAAYPSYEMGALMVGATSVAADDPNEWPESTRLVWLNSPGNPDGRVLTVDELQRAIARARALGAIVASDECYAEFGYDAPWDKERIPSALDPRVVGSDFENVLVLYSLSKQSAMAGYRTAFVVGDSALLASILTVRKHAGLMMPAPMQAAMTAALGDDEHVDAAREKYRERRSILKPAVETAGFRVDRSEAGLYLWVSRGTDTWETMSDLADLGILAGPGVFYGDFPRHVRLALTAPTERITAAASRLRASFESSGAS